MGFPAQLPIVKEFDVRIALRNCPICDHDRVDVLHSQRFVVPDGHPLSDGYDVVVCIECGFVYADTAVNQAAFDRFYAEYSKYEDRETGTGGMDKGWDRNRLEETASQIVAFLGDSSARLLDVGCANGGLLKALKNLEYRKTLGIDPSPTCVENTRSLGINAEIGSLFQEFSAGKFDCVILSHTLEHVHDLKQAADWIKSVLSVGGFVYIEVPDAMRYTDFVDAPFQDFNTEHINHFSRASLNNFFHMNGFAPLEYGEKIIPASADKPYPAIFCFAQLARKFNVIERDENLREKIEQYIEKSQVILDAIEERLKSVFSNSKKIIVWGTGQLTMKLLAETSLGQAEIVAFVDNNPINQGKILRGVRIVAPEAILDLEEPILIASTLHQQSIVQQINTIGIRNPIVLLKV